MRALSVIGVSVAAAVVLTLVASYPSYCDSGDGWSSMESGTGKRIFSMWGTSPHVFASGWDGTILHYDGLAWSAMSSGSDDWFWGIWGNSPSDVFAVGSGAKRGGRGVVLHYDGDDWNEMLVTDTDLYDVWSASSCDVFAVGEKGTVMHFDGSSWTHMNSTREL